MLHTDYSSRHWSYLKILLAIRNIIKMITYYCPVALRFKTISLFVWTHWCTKCIYINKPYQKYSTHIWRSHVEVLWASSLCSFIDGECPLLADSEHSTTSPSLSALYSFILIREVWIHGSLNYTFSCSSLQLVLGDHQVLPRMLTDVVLIEFVFSTAHFRSSLCTAGLPSRADLKEMRAKYSRKGDRRICWCLL